MNPRRALSYGLAALAFCVPLSIAGANAALAVLTVGLLWLFADRRELAAAAPALREVMRSPVLLALTAYVAWGVVASAAGVDPAASLRLFPKDAHKIWAFVTIAAALAAADFIWIKAPFATAMGLHAAVGVFQAIQEWTGGVERVRAHGFLHPVSYAEILGLGLIGAGSYLARADASPRDRRAAKILLALTSAALVFSQTRAAVVAVGVAFMTACFLEPRWRRHSLKALLIVVCVIGFWEIMPTDGRNIRSLFSRSQDTSSHRARLVLWDVAARIAVDHPTTGVGPGRYRQTFELYHPAKLDSEGTWGNAHNLYFHQLAERGIPGLLAILTVLCLLFKGAWDAERTRRNWRSLWAVAATSAFLVMNLTEVAWQTEQVATLFLFAWLLGAGPLRSREIL